MSAPESRPLILWFAGVGWDEVRGTDHRLVTALSEQATILWCDPPRAFWRERSASLLQRDPIDWVAPGIGRIAVPTIPCSTRVGFRDVAALHTRWVVSRVLATLDRPPVVQVVASPMQRFQPGLEATRVFYQTDDWQDGAGLMGLSRQRITRTMRSNSRDAHVVAAVTNTLLEVMAATAPTGGDTTRAVLANGCEILDEPAVAVPREPVAGLVGQINERLDLSMVQSVVDRGIPLRVIGPRRDQDADFGRDLDRLLSAPGVEYLGAVSSTEVPGHLARLGVGLTPYAQTAFNRASFPLKSLEYLSGGLAVVSTDLPAVTWLDTDLVAVGRDPEEFALFTAQALEGVGDTDRERDRRRFAAGHSWAERADQFMRWVGDPVAS